VTIFSQLKDIIQTKSGKLLDDMQTYNDFQPYIVSRWLSMHSNVYTYVLNETTNRLYPAIQNKDMWYKLLTSIVPKDKYRYIKYIKKEKKEKHADEDTIAFLATNLRLSKREIKEYIQIGDIDIATIKKGIKNK